MSVRIPIIEQQSSTGYVPIGPVSAVQVDDARPKAMQGLAGAIGEVGEMISQRQKKAAAKAAAQAAANDASSIKELEDTKAWTMDSYASCVAQAADLDTQVQGGGSDSSNGAAAADAAGGAASGTSSGAASGFPGGLGQFLRTPTLDQILGGALPGLSGAQAGQPGAAGVIGSALGGVTGGEAAAPHPLDVQAHGQTGAWANGYDLIAAERVGAAPNEQARQAIAAQCSLDRARGVGQVMAREALGNVQARESGFARSVGIIAARRLAQDPGALGEMLTFTRQNMIRVGAGRQAAFEARMENMLIGTAVQAEAGRDPEGLVAALAQRAGEKANSGAQEGSAQEGSAQEGSAQEGSAQEGSAQEGVAATQGEAAPEGAAAHPIASALTPAQARAWLPRAQAGLEIARTNQRADVQQSYDTALRDIAASGDASRLPSEAQLVATHGAEQGKLMAAQAAKAIEERELYGNLRASPSTTLHDMLGEEQDTLDREAQAATAAGTANGNAPVNAAAPVPSTSRRAIERILRERERDPMQAALDTGGYGLAALDVSSAQAAQQGLLARIAPSAQVSGQYGTQRRLFTDTEAPKVASLVQALPGEEQAQWLRDLIGGANDGQAVQDALRELSPHAPALAMAGRLMLREQGASGDPYQWGGAGTINAADQITSGAALIKEDKANLPPDQETRRAFRIGIGETFADQPGEEAMRYDAMLAAYAGLSQRAGDATGKFDQRRWEAAEYLVNVGSGTERDMFYRENDLNQSIQGSNGNLVMSPVNPLSTLNPRSELDRLALEGGENGARDITEGEAPDSTLPSGSPLEGDQVARREKMANQYAFNEMSGLPIPDIGAGASTSTRVSEKENGPLRPGLFKDEEHEYARRVMRNIANPPPGTSNTAIGEFAKRNASEIKKLIAAGPGKTSFGNPQPNQIRKKGFDVPLLPEQYTDDPNDPTHHEYGVLTYLGRVDAEKGVTKDGVVDLLVERRTRPGYQLRPVPPASSVYNNVYATSPAWTIADRFIGNDDYVMKKENYTHEIGSIAQVRVPDGIVNITATDHKSYPGTIRRTIVEVDGHLFVYTQGSGENRAQNEPIASANSVTDPKKIPETIATRFGGAWGNGVFGPKAFEMVDKGLFEDVERLRKGIPLEPVDMTPVRLPPSHTVNNPRRGVQP